MSWWCLFWGGRVSRASWHLMRMRPRSIHKRHGARALSGDGERDQASNKARTGTHAQASLESEWNGREEFQQTRTEAQSAADGGHEILRW